MAIEILGSRLEGTKLIVSTTDGEKSYDSKFLIAALLVYVARGSGKIEPEESGKIIELIEHHFSLQGADQRMLMIHLSESLGGIILMDDLLPQCRRCQVAVLTVESAAVHPACRRYQ